MKNKEMPEVVDHYFDPKKTVPEMVGQMIDDGVLRESDRNDLNKFEFAFEVREMTEAELLSEALELLSSLAYSKRCSCAGPGNGYVCPKCRGVAMLTSIKHEGFMQEYWEREGES